MYHPHDEKELNWEPGGVRSGAGVRRSGLSQESSGSSETWEEAALPAVAEAVLLGRPGPRLSGTNGVRVLLVHRGSFVWRTTARLPDGSAGQGLVIASESRRMGVSSLPGSWGVCLGCVSSGNAAVWGWDNWPAVEVRGAWLGSPRFHSRRTPGEG